MTATATPRRKRGHGSPVTGTERPAPTATERRLLLALCAGRERRDRDRDDTARLAAHADAARLSGLLDHLLLAPPRGARASLRRERQKIPDGLERALTRHDGLSAHRARAEHLLRLLRRWTLAVGPAAVRARRDTNGAAAAVAERVVA